MHNFMSVSYLPVSTSRCGLQAYNRHQHRKRRYTVHTGRARQRPWQRPGLPTHSYPLSLAPLMLPLPMALTMAALIAALCLEVKLPPLSRVRRYVSFAYIQVHSTTCLAHRTDKYECCSEYVSTNSLLVFGVQLVLLTFLTGQDFPLTGAATAVLVCAGTL